MKMAELTGRALDWAVASAGGLDYETAGGTYMEGDESDEYYGCSFTTLYSPSTNWAQGGVIIEREKIRIVPSHTNKWHAAITSSAGGVLWWMGNSPLEAAMRCYCASNLGDKVEIPEELL